MEIIAKDGDIISIPASGQGCIEMSVHVKTTHSQSVPDAIWHRDIRDELVTNDDCPGILADGWWKRQMTRVDGVTIHHTLSHSPHATARCYVHKGGGRPSIPYHFWITQTGEILYCLELQKGCWHDHTGHKNTHISVGMAGSLHLHKPPEPQLDAAALCVARTIGLLELPINSVRGHLDYYNTICPGWNQIDWKLLLCKRVKEIHNGS